MDYEERAKAMLGKIEREAWDNREPPPNPSKLSRRLFSKKPIAREIDEKRKKMTRAQQRKLGRVIREGKTGAMKRKEFLRFDSPERYRKPTMERMRLNRDRTLLRLAEARDVVSQHKEKMARMRRSKVERRRGFWEHEEKLLKGYQSNVEEIKKVIDWQENLRRDVISGKHKKDWEKEQKQKEIEVRKKVEKAIREGPGRDLRGNPNFGLRVARGKGRRVFHIEESKEKGWKQTGYNQYAKQAYNWKALDVDTTPASQLQLRGLRDRRTHGTRLIGRGVNPRRLDRSREYRSARNEALIQMRINETAGVRDAKSKAEKEIKDIRISEAQKALNLKLAKETAEKTTEALKAKTAGITHSYNVNVRNQTASTLLGSDPDELNKLLRKGGGLALIKGMVRKGEISDLSTIGQLNLSNKQKGNLMRLLNEGGDYIEGQEYFFRMLDDFGRTKIQRGYLNRGGERKDNLELMYIQTLPDGSTKTERFLVPKGNILKPDDHTSTTSSGKRQPKTEPRKISEFELDLFAGEGEGGGTELPEDVSHFGQRIAQDPKTGVKSLVKSKGAGIADPSPPKGVSILKTLKEDSLEFDTMGGSPSIPALEGEEGSGTSEEAFEFGGEAPTEYGARQPEPEPTTEEEKEVKHSPMVAGWMGQKSPTELDLGAGEAQLIADELGGGMLLKPAGTEEMIKALAEEHDKPIEGASPPPKLLDPAELLEAHQLQQGGKEGPLPEGLLRSPSPKPKKPEDKPKTKGPSGKEDKPKTKELSITEEIGELFGEEPRDVGDSDVPMGWVASDDVVPEALLKENWDMRKRGLTSKMEEGGSQEVPEGHIAVYTTRQAELNNQTVLLVNEADIYRLMRGLRGHTLKNDKGNEKKLTDNTLKSFYRKVVEGIRDGKKYIAFNDKQLLRGLDMIELYEEEEEEEEEDDY